MEFKDFLDNPQDLVGKTVLYEVGMSYSIKRTRQLLKIEKVTKAGFRLTSKPGELFSLIDGEQRGTLTGRMNMGTISKCRLVPELEADKIRQQWSENRETRDLREKILERIPTLTLTQLKEVANIIL